jgi:hypothetical protein
MSTIEELVGERDPQSPVELVTLTGDISQGAAQGSGRPFPDLTAALDFADTLPPDERERSWIRTAEGTLTLAAAEASLAAQKKE